MDTKPRLYLDHAATTPVIAVARDAIMKETRLWANPSSPHGEGRASKARLEQYRRDIAHALKWDGHILFTSGASEAISMVMHDYQDDIYVSAGEHEAVLMFSDAREKNHIIPLLHDGYLDQNAMKNMLKGAQRPLCAIQSVNNETGVIQPLDELADIVHQYGGIIFADCSQSAGKAALPNADIIILSGHKLGASPGIGALLIRDLSLLKPTGGQEQGYRRGTENLPYIAGMAAAISNGYIWMDEAKRLRALLDKAIVDMGGEIIAENSNRMATIGSYKMPNVLATAQLIEFDMKGVAVSAGSACSSGTLKTSHVLMAMDYDIDAASQVIRVSFGPDTCEQDIKYFIEIWRALSMRKKI